VISLGGLADLDSGDTGDGERIIGIASGDAATCSPGTQSERHRRTARQPVSAEGNDPPPLRSEGEPAVRVYFQAGAEGGRALPISHDDLCHADEYLTPA